MWIVDQQNSKGGQLKIVFCTAAGMLKIFSSLTRPSSVFSVDVENLITRVVRSTAKTEGKREEEVQALLVPKELGRTTLQ